MPILVQNHCQVYMAPVSTYVAGWAEIVVSDVQQKLHNHVVNIITNNLPNYDKIQKHHIRLITEDGQIATVYEFMCGYLTTTRDAEQTYFYTTMYLYLPMIGYYGSHYN
uniref:Uncharacterized protein n=1 Tax=Romanomermis culicivorax TaxID=13658 RepID=A0A915JFB9_ROMCU